MNEDLKQKLFRTYPKIFPETVRESPIFEISCNDGWFDLIDEFCSFSQARIDADPEIHQVTVSHIKEKFARLRIMYRGGDDEIFERFREANNRSAFVCELCGSTENAGLCIKNNLLKTLCPACRTEKNFQLCDPNLTKKLAAQLDIKY